VCIFLHAQAKALTEEAASARERGKVNNALETALSRAQASGGTMALRSKRKNPDGAQAAGVCVCVHVCFVMCLCVLGCVYVCVVV
jgi:hypothetical protein